MAICRMRAIGLLQSLRFEQASADFLPQPPACPLFLLRSSVQFVNPRDNTLFVSMLAVKQQVPGVKQRLDSLNDLNRALLQNRYHKVLHVRAGNNTHHQKASLGRPTMKNQFDGGTALVEAFRKLGVEYILSSPGTEWAPVWEAMADQIHRKKSGPKLLDVWHETLAVDMAAGYTLATGKM